MKQLDTARSYFEALKIRERWLIYVAAAVVTLLLADNLMLLPVEGKIKARKAEVARLEEENASMQSQLQSLQALLANDPVDVKIRERDALQQQVQEQEAELAAMSGGLVKPQLLPELLEQMLQQVKGLELIAMETLSAERQLTGVYRHEVHLTLSGGYQNVLAYLKALESLPWKFYWQDFNYRVEQYPSARVDIKVYTLSTAESIYGA